MKRYYIMLIIIAQIIFSCSRKQYVVDKKFSNKESINLDAYHGANDNQRVQSIIHSQDAVLLYLDGKKYDITQYKEITDTIKGDYKIDLENESKLLKIIRKK